MVNRNLSDVQINFNFTDWSHKFDPICDIIYYYKNYRRIFRRNHAGTKRYQL